jgi:hypothetical protein
VSFDPHVSSPKLLSGFLLNLVYQGLQQKLWSEFNFPPYMHDKIHILHEDQIEIRNSTMAHRTKNQYLSQHTPLVNVYSFYPNHFISI